MALTVWVPRDVAVVGGMDWGFHSPGCIGWAAVWEGEHGPRLHVVREWRFTETPDEEIADGYRARTRELGVKVQYVAADPSMWIRDGRTAGRGQSRAETLIRAGMPLKKAENDRESGWSRLHSWLRVVRDEQGCVVGEPLLTVDAACAYLRRSVPAQRSNATHADDVDTTGDDHGVDMLRYLVMSRPTPRRVAASKVVPYMSPAWFKAQGEASRGILGRR